MSISQNLEKIRITLPENIELIAVSKTQPAEAILEIYNAGQRSFGENKIQEMVEKYQILPKDIQWHMIGHLQTNKIKYIASFVHLIHGVDSLKKLEEINKQAIKHNRIIHCLLQLKIAKEETKFGMSFEEMENLLLSEKTNDLTHIFVDGFMGMASFTENEAIIKCEFGELRNFFTKSKAFKSLNFEPTILSMGMSGDYKLAIEEGSTMVRIGSSIFGNRNYI